MVVLGFALAVALSTLAFRFGGDLAKVELNGGLRLVLIAIGSLVVFTLLFSLLISFQLERHEKTQRWLINAVNWNVQRLKAHGLAQLPEEKLERQSNAALSPVVIWPWGTHNTELLGHLDAAARHFWRLYDPSDFSTAPTNEMVSDWLQEERGVSKDKAKAIASILRADGLPTGPRR